MSNLRLHKQLRCVVGLLLQPVLPPPDSEESHRSNLRRSCTPADSRNERRLRFPLPRKLSAWNCRTHLVPFGMPGGSPPAEVRSLPTTDRETTATDRMSRIRSHNWRGFRVSDSLYFLLLSCSQLALIAEFRGCLAAQEIFPVFEFLCLAQFRRGQERLVTHDIAIQTVREVLIMSDGRELLGLFAGQ